MIALLSIGGSYINSVIVQRLGMFTVVRATYVAQLVMTLAVLGLVTLFALPLGVEFALHILWSIGIFAMMGLTMGNLNALAMERLGHIAGFAASVITAVSTVLSVLIAVPVGLAFNGTQVPLLVGASVFSALALVLVLTLRPNPISFQKS